MFNFVRLSDGGITRLEDVRPESAILADIAIRLVPDCPIDFSVFKHHRSIREAIAHIVPGMEDLATIEDARKEFHISNRLMHQPVFSTPSGKAAFKPVAMSEVRKTDGGDAPFMLSTMRSEGQFNSIIYEEKDSYRGTRSRWSVLMNRQDIAALGLTAGDKVTLRSRQGEMAAVEVCEFDVPRGDVFAYYPEANVLTATAVDPRSFTPSFKATPIWIEPDSPLSGETAG
jgi:anaerobic selenocysteine-containing dehydrogenase